MILLKVYPKENQLFDYYWDIFKGKKNCKLIDYNYYLLSDRVNPKELIIIYLFSRATGRANLRFSGLLIIIIILLLLTDSTLSLIKMGMTAGKIGKKRGILPHPPKYFFDPEYKIILTNFKFFYQKRAWRQGVFHVPKIWK